jgi:hypothetical protein
LLTKRRSPQDNLSLLRLAVVELESISELLVEVSLRVPVVDLDPVALPVS